MSIKNNTKITWCPGCPNFGILTSFDKAVEELIEGGIFKKENIVVSSGIGCHGKITEYLNLNTFTALHGRGVATLQGVKIGNPSLKCVAFSGDGDAYAEGLEHLVHAAKRNVDITVIVHNNETFALTTGQFTPTSPKGFKGKTTPFGSPEEPINALSLLLTAGASFIARGYALDILGTKDLIKKALEHKGFAILEIMQPCIAFNDNREYLKIKMKESESENLADINKSRALLEDEKHINLGVIYQENKPIYEDEI